MSEKRDRRGCEPGAGTVEPAHGGRIGNPPHVVTQEMRDKVRLLAKVTALMEGVAETLEVSVDTIKRYYREDYFAGRREAVTAVKSKMLSQAMAGSVNAQWKFLQLMGEVPRMRVEHSGPNGGPIPTVDLSRLSDEELEAYGRLAAIAEGIDPDSIFIEHLPDERGT